MNTIRRMAISRARAPPITILSLNLTATAVLQFLQIPTGLNGLWMV